jgi:hypothetical protein
LPASCASIGNFGALTETQVEPITKPGSSCLTMTARQGEGTLDIYLRGDRKPVPDLQAIFADTILTAELGPDEKDERVYDLNPLRSRQFQFVYGLEAGIAEVAVKKLRLTVYGKKEHIVLDADPTYNKHAADGGHSSWHQGDIRP